MYRNKKITRDYQVLDSIECGIELLGGEAALFRPESTMVRPLDSVRVTVEDGELWAYGILGEGRHRLLAHKGEIRALRSTLETSGHTLVVSDIHRKDGRIKVQVAEVKGLSKVDKRQKLRAEQDARDAAEALR